MDKNIGKKLICCAGWNVRKLARLFGQIYDESYRATGLKNTQFTLLAVLCGKGPMTINNLAEFIGADRTTMTRNLNVIEKQSLIKIAISKDDPRAREVSITERGKLLFQNAYPHWQETQKQIISILGEKDWEIFFSLLTKLNQESAKILK